MSNIKFSDFSKDDLQTFDRNDRTHNSVVLQILKLKASEERLLAFQNKQRFGLNTGKGLTEQSHKKSADINFLIKDMTPERLKMHAIENAGRYDDVSASDYQKSMILLANANSLFETLPAVVRSQFSNDPQQFLYFVQDDANGPALQEMGIIRGNDGLDINGMPTQAPTIPAEAPKASNTTPSADGEVSSPEGGESTSDS